MQVVATAPRRLLEAKGMCPDVQLKNPRMYPIERQKGRVVRCNVDGEGLAIIDPA